MPVINPTHHTFDFSVTEASHVEPVVVAFTAPWCGPCRTLKPKLTRLSEDWGFTLALVDAQDQPDLSSLFGVRAVPTVIVIEAGVPRGRFTGDRTEEALAEYLREMGLAQTAIRLEF